MPKLPIAADTINVIKKLEHEEMRRQLLEMVKLSSESKNLPPIGEVIPALQALTSDTFASQTSVHMLSGILNSIYDIPSQDIAEMMAQHRDRLGSPRDDPVRVRVQLSSKDANDTAEPQDSSEARSGSHLKHHEVKGPDISEKVPQQLVLEKKHRHSKGPVSNETNEATQTKGKTRRRTRIKLELSSDAPTSGAEPSLKRKHVSKKQAKLETLQSVSHLVVLFNVPTKGDATAVPYLYIPNLWLGGQQSISYESFLSLDKLVSRSEFLSAFGLLAGGHSTDGQSHVPPLVKRTSSVLPPEQPKNDIDMRASLASLLSTSSEYRANGMISALSGKPRSAGQPPASIAAAVSSPTQVKKDPVPHLLTQLLLAANGIPLTVNPESSTESPASSSEFTQVKETLEFSLYYQNASFFERAISDSSQRLNNALEWASVLSQTVESSTNAEIQPLLSSLAVHTQLPIHDTGRKSPFSHIYISLSLKCWLNIQQPSSPSRPLSSLQRIIIAKLKLPNPLPAAHNLDSDSRLLFFSKRVVSQALLNLYYNSSSTVVAHGQPCTHLTKYLLPMGIPPMRLVLVEKSLCGPLFDPYERYSLMSVHHPELQFLVAPPRYLEQPTFMQSPGICTPPLGPARSAPRLTLEIEQTTGSTNLVLDEVIDPGICIMDIVGCYLPIEEAHRILCHMIERGLHSNHSYADVWNEVVRYCSHCIYLEELRIIIDMNRCSSLSVYVQFDRSNNEQETANCELGLCYSLDYVTCRLYSTVSIVPGTSIRLPSKYQWLNREPSTAIAGCTVEDMRKLLVIHIKGCESFIADPLDSILAVPAYDPFVGGYSLLSYPGPYLSLVKEIIAVMMSVSYREASKFVSADHQTLLEACRIGLRNPGPGYTDTLPKSAQARVTLQRNIELAQRLVLSIMAETENLNLFFALDRDNLLDKQSIDTDILVPVIAQRLKGCYLYSHRCRHVMNDTPPTPGSSSAVFLKQAMDNKANAVKRIGTEYNHFLLLYRLAFAVQAMEDLFSHPLITAELFLQVDSQSPIFGYMELELEVPQEQLPNQSETKPACLVVSSSQKKEEMTAQVTTELRVDTYVAPTRTNLKFDEPTEQESKSSSPRPMYDKDISECQSFYIQEPYATSSTPYIDLNSVRLVSTLDYLLGEPLPDKSLAAMITEDEMRRGLSNALGYGY